MYKTCLCGLLAMGLTLTQSVSTADAVRTLSAQWTPTAPVVDGDGSDTVWRAAHPMTVTDRVAGIPIELTVLYDAQDIYLRAVFPDPQEDRSHKGYIWDPGAGRYRTGPSREDTLVLKWAMDPAVSDLSLQTEQSYRADIWYWKAGRTDPVGYADDKYQTYSRSQMPQAMQLSAPSGLTFFLRRSGDQGEGAYRAVTYVEFAGERMPKFVNQEPTGSRADIRAKGRWRDGYWTIEFSRRLDTGHADDVAFDPGRSYLFGVSRHEIAGRRPDPNIAEPNFGAGDIAEHLRLIFAPAN